MKKTAGTSTIQGMLSRALEMYHFIDGHLDADRDVRFNIEGEHRNEHETYIIMVDDSLALGDVEQEEYCMTIEVLQDPTDERVRESINEWYACLKWLQTITGCILTEEDPEFTGEVKPKDEVITLIMPSRLAEIEEHEGGEDEVHPEAQAFIAVMRNFGYAFLDFGEYNPPTCDMLFTKVTPKEVK